MVRLLVLMTGAVSFVVKIFTEASASVASMVVTALTGKILPQEQYIFCGDIVPSQVSWYMGTVYFFRLVVHNRRWTRLVGLYKHF